jgi:hypothetical protein
MAQVSGQSCGQAARTTFRRSEALAILSSQLWRYRSALGAGAVAATRALHNCSAAVIGLNAVIEN